MCGTLSDERMGLQFTCTIASRPCQSSHSWVEVPQNPRPNLTVSSETPPNLVGQVPVFISPRNRVAQSYPRALGSLLSPLTTCRDCNLIFAAISFKIVSLGTIRLPNQFFPCFESTKDVILLNAVKYYLQFPLAIRLKLKLNSMV
jgi:hypothetical protein